MNYKLHITNYKSYMFFVSQNDRFRPLPIVPALATAAAVASSHHCMADTPPMQHGATESNQPSSWISKFVAASQPTRKKTLWMQEYFGHSGIRTPKNKENVNVQNVKFHLSTIHFPHLIRE